MKTSAIHTGFALLQWRGHLARSLPIRLAATAIAICLFAPASFAAPAPPDKPILWRVEGNGLEKPSHLFGTIHLSNERIAQLHPAAERAFNAADSLHTEISFNIGDQMAAGIMMMRRDGMKLSQSIGPELTAEIKARLAEIHPDLDMTILEPMKTWAAATMLVMLPYQLDGTKALDVILWERATEQEKSTGGLEKIADQFGAFEILNEQEQIIYLRETLAQMKEGKDMIPDLISAYEAGDIGKIDRLVTESMELSDEDEEVRRIGERLIESLITKRDESMAAAIHNILKEEPARSHFFAVGTAHYLGEISIRSHLEAKGYTITRITE